MTSQREIIWRRCSETLDRPAVIVVVNKDKLVPLDHQVNQEMMVLLVKMVNLVTLVLMPPLATALAMCLNNAHAKADLADVALLDLLAHLVNLETQEAPETMVLLVLLVNLEDLAHKVPLVDLDPKDHLVLLDNKPMEDPDQLDLQVLLAHKDPLDPTDNLVNLDLVLKDHPAQLAHQDHLVNLEAMADLDLLVNLVNLVALALAATAQLLDWPLDTNCKQAGCGLGTACLYL